MHEWALAESVIRKTAEHAAREKLAPVSEVGVALGELQAIDREIFSFALKELVKSSFKGLSSCRFRIIKEPAAFKCKACSEEFTLKVLKKTDEEAENIHFIPEMAHTFLKCPRCKSPDFDITAGRGVSIRHIRGGK
ncbi:MAG: hydrogenase nickel incorporation protein HypA [Elusimicrobiales bacterium]|jgi:hydrogenase nickel incorporation protein HypA/HybF